MENKNIIVNAEDVKNVETLAKVNNIPVERVAEILKDENYILIENNIVRVPEFQLTLDNIKSNRIYTKKGGWNDMLYFERWYYLDLMKKYLLTKCRSGSKVYKSINNLTIDNLENIKTNAMTRRLVFEPKENKVIYIPGQDERLEREQLKKTIIKACY